MAAQDDNDALRKAVAAYKVVLPASQITRLKQLARNNASPAHDEGDVDDNASTDDVSLDDEEAPGVGDADEEQVVNQEDRGVLRAGDEVILLRQSKEVATRVVSISGTVRLAGLGQLKPGDRIKLGDGGFEPWEQLRLKAGQAAPVGAPAAIKRGVLLPGNCVDVVRGRKRRRDCIASIGARWNSNGTP